MFMKCFKKKLTTGLLVVSVVCGLSSSAFAGEISENEISNSNASCEKVFRDKDMSILSCKINGKEFIIARKLVSYAGITIVQVK